MKLVPPSLRYKNSFTAAYGELRAEEESLRHKQSYGASEIWEEIGSPKTVEEYIRLRNDHAKGDHLPERWVSYSTLWLIDGNDVIGETSVRHKLTEHLRTVGGHIGYWIRPSKRGQGYGTEILRLALKHARALGIDDVVVTCDETNEASKKIIEANGGIYDGNTDMGPDAPKKLRYWIHQ